MENAFREHEGLDGDGVHGSMGTSLNSVHLLVALLGVFWSWNWNPV